MGRTDVRHLWALLTLLLVASVLIALIDTGRWSDLIAGVPIALSLLLAMHRLETGALGSVDQVDDPPSSTVTLETFQPAGCWVRFTTTRKTSACGVLLVLLA